jgi:uncharacterized integral membrane protein
MIGMEEMKTENSNTSSTEMSSETKKKEPAKVPNKWTFIIAGILTVILSIVFVFLSIDENSRTNLYIQIPRAITYEKTGISGGVFENLSSAEIKSIQRTLKKGGCRTVKTVELYDVINDYMMSGEMEIIGFIFLVTTYGGSQYLMSMNVERKIADNVNKAPYKIKTVWFRLFLFFLIRQEFFCDRLICLPT